MDTLTVQQMALSTLEGRRDTPNRGLPQDKETPLVMRLKLAEGASLYEARVSVGAV